MSEEISSSELASKGILVPKILPKPFETINEELNLNTKINTIELLFNLKQAIQQERWDIQRKFLRMARYLYLVHRDEAWRLEEAESFHQWINDNYEFIGMRERNVYNLLEIFRTLVVNLHIKLEELEKVKITEALEIIKYATPKNIYQLINIAKSSPNLKEFKLGLRALATGEKWDEINTKICHHNNLIVIYKCQDCGFHFFSLPKGSRNVVDKEGFLDPNKIDKEIKLLQNSVVKSREQDKDRKKTLTRGLQKMQV